MKKRLVLILVYVFVDVLGFTLILPLLPFYARTLDATPAAVGLLLGANALTQFFGAPLIGRLSDRYGRRPLLLVSLSGTVVGFLLLGLSNSLWMLFLSRILDGLLGGTSRWPRPISRTSPTSAIAPKGLASSAPPLAWALSLARRSAAC